MDIVERLRPHGLMGQSAETRLKQEAADEIERLREALQKIDLATSVYALKNIPEVVSQLVRSALQQKDTE